MHPLQAAACCTGRRKRAASSGSREGGPHSDHLGWDSVQSPLGLRTEPPQQGKAQKGCLCLVKGVGRRAERRKQHPGALDGADAVLLLCGRAVRLTAPCLGFPLCLAPFHLWSSWIASMFRHCAVLLSTSCNFRTALHSLARGRAVASEGSQAWEGSQRMHLSSFALLLPEFRGPSV